MLCNLVKFSSKFRLSLSSRSISSHFKRDLKQTHRDISARLQELNIGVDPTLMQDHVAGILAERLEDITQSFPVAVEIGCGSGSLRKCIGNRGGIETLVQLDLSEKLLSLNQEAGVENQEIEDDEEEEDEKIGATIKRIHYIHADEEYLPLKPHSYDLVISSLSLHWVNDLPSVLKQIRLSLKPNGAFIAVLYGGDTLQELSSCFAAAEQERLGGVSLHVSPLTTGPDVGSLLQAAGFTLPTIDTSTVNVPYDNAFHLMEHLQSMGEGNASLLSKTSTSSNIMLATAAAYQGMYGDSDGSVTATYQFIFLIAWAPHDSQPKPLQRGSATHRMKDIKKGLIETTP